MSKCGHGAVSRRFGSYGETHSWVCLDCDAVGVRSLGPSNDSNPEHADEISSAQWTRVADLYIDEDGEIEWGFNGDGWPWDPTRPLAGQYEERNASRILRRAMLAGDPATLAESMAERGCIDETIRADLGLVAVALLARPRRGMRSATVASKTRAIRVSRRTFERIEEYAAARRVTMEAVVDALLEFLPPPKEKS